MNHPALRIALRAVALVLCAAALHRFVYLPWLTNHVLYDVKVRSQRAIDVGGSTGVILARNNIDRLREIAGPARCDANFYMLYAANARLIGDAPGAIEQYSRALANADHRPEIYYERGLEYMAAGNLDAAADDLTHAARFNPVILDDLSGELHTRVEGRVRAH